jgi:4-amino-4-deoxy-L-arabinose transferase-like glycosyltransferase
MNDFNKEWQSLWQQQTTQAIDIKDIGKRLKRQQKLQRLYLVIDILGFLPFMYIFAFMRDKFSTGGVIALALVAGICVIFYGYISWLRRHAMTARFDDTELYVSLLKKQLYNNHRIAALTMHSCWVTFIGLLVLMAVLAVTGEPKAQSWLALLKLLPGSAVFLLIIGIWARRRSNKFKQEYRQLCDLLAQDS